MNALATGWRLKNIMQVLAGFHRLKISYKKSHDDDPLQVDVDGPGTELQPLPPEWLFRPIEQDRVEN